MCALSPLRKRSWMQGKAWTSQLCKRSAACLLLAGICRDVWSIGAIMHNQRHCTHWCADIDALAEKDLCCHGTSVTNLRQIPLLSQKAPSRRSNGG